MSTVDSSAAFDAAQAADPFDPTPMLIRADWLEEQGDAAGAAVLRGLVDSGIPSLHALALDAALISVPWHPDDFWSEGCANGAGDGDSLAAGVGVMEDIGYGFGYAELHGNGPGDDSHGEGTGRVDGSGFEGGGDYGRGGGYGRGEGIGDTDESR